MPIHELVVSTVALMLTAIGVRVLSKRYNLPYSVLLVLAGVALAHLTRHAPFELHHFATLEVSPQIILLIFLPTLVFESAFNLDARQLRRNLLPVLFLAVPGVLLSTAVIGAVLWWFTPLDLYYALILGALLSATDPVAVITLFKQLGAPKRLTVLVEGESLFNDATAIVLTRILIAVALSGTLSAHDAAAGAVQFFTVFVGGLAVGAAAALLVGWLLGQVESDPFIEVPLTVVLAYAAFMIAEEVHFSGVMAVVAAGIVMGGWGRTKISPNVSHYLSELWEYFAFTANALIFLLVGLLVDLPALADSLDLLVWVIAAMLVSRLAVVYLLVPLSNRLPGAQTVNRTYQHIMYWGGLRGAIALALALSLPESQYRELFIALTAGAVLFTLVVQGLSIGPLVHYLGLDRPSPGERLTAAGAALDAARKAHNTIPKLRNGGLFSQRIATVLEYEYSAKIRDLTARRAALALAELTPEQERSLLFLYGFVTEKQVYYEMFGQGSLGEADYRDLIHSLDLQIDRILLDGTLPDATLHTLFSQRAERTVLHLLERFLGMTDLPQRFSNRMTARDYNKSWGQYNATRTVLRQLPELAAMEGISDDVLHEVETFYRRWGESARGRLDSTAEQFPEFAGAMQERLARRLLLLKSRRVIEAHLRDRRVSERMGGELLAEIDGRLRALNGFSTNALSIDPDELLTKVPFFRHMVHKDFEEIKRYLRPLTVPEDEIIIRQGEAGSSMFFIVRGVVRILVEEEGSSKELGTLMGGDFFGEHSLLNRAPRNATCRAVTACALYELHRGDFDELVAAYPEVKRAFDAANARRSG